MKTLYEQDFYAWTLEQVKLLRQHKWELLDTSNLIEEIEDLGKSVRKELRSRLAVLIGHLLKWQYQPEMRSNSWLATIREQRREIKELLKENPSLRSLLDEALLLGFQGGLDLAVRETNLPYTHFPETCPYILAQVLDTEFLPSE